MGILIENSLIQQNEIEKQFDLIVIGGGSGGIASAVRAAIHGAKVAVIEHQHLGGTCVNIGCVPKKVMWYAAHIQSMMHKAKDYGFGEINTCLNWQKLKVNRDKYIARLRTLYENRFNSLNITHIQGLGKFESANTVRVNDTCYQANHIVIATGGKPWLPNIPGIEFALTSDDFFKLTQQPKAGRNYQHRISPQIMNISCWGKHGLKKTPSRNLDR